MQDTHLSSAENEGSSPFWCTKSKFQQQHEHDLHLRLLDTGSIEALNPKTVERIQLKLMNAIVSRVKKCEAKVYIDRSLYYSPLALNNRASSLSLSGKAIGTVEKLPEDGKIVRVYVHWVERHDIDLSGFVICKDNSVVKVGWNGDHKYGTFITYSGDNTGHSHKNAEYLDIQLSGLKDVEWIVVDAKVYRGPKFSKWGGEGVLAGWMMREFPEANTRWLPETVEHAMKMGSDAKSAYLCAIHVPRKNLVYLDVAQTQESNVTTANDALKMRSFLEKFVVLDNGSDEVEWKKLSQGHILNLLATNIVDSPENADIVFDENTTWETVSKSLTEESITF